ncbi:radical SAM/SPASM domain-containing protein [Abyssisolibacter fermentans]|uniref:radical SAM/SPASM domain-containing protein n=1 Tax=Abyssisolibacter fermentans TaxID=1766203 RepID=UPI0008327311|nr:radical SAM protein [Abyssisolibacter fermentans]
MLEKVKTNFYWFEERNEYYLFNKNNFYIYHIDKEMYDFLKLTEKNNIKRHENLNYNYYLDKLQELDNKIDFFSVDISDEELLDRYLKKKFHLINIVPSLTCNLGCKYCYSQKARKEINTDSVFLSKDIAKKIVDMICKDDIFGDLMSIRFVGGGEPLTNFEVIKFIVESMERNKKDKTVVYRLSTNGLLINNEMLKFFKKYKFKIKISIDGPGFEHNRSRFKNNEQYNKLIKIINKSLIYLGNEDVIVAITFYPHKESAVQKIKGCIDLGFKYIKYQPVINSDIRSIKNEYHSKLLNNEDDVINFYRNHLLNTDINNIKFLDSIDLIIDNINKSRFKYVTCYGGINDVAFSTIGNIYTCNRFINNDEFKIGDIINGIDFIKRREYIRKVSLSERHSCKDCFIVGFCGGKCVYNIYSLYNCYTSTDMNICQSSMYSVESVKKIISLFVELKEKKPEVLDLILNREYF